MIPDKIYLAWEYSEIDTLPPGVTTKQVFDKDVCYIRKDALLEWAKQKQYESLTIVADNFWQEVIDKINEI
jgi:hypothetical protein